MFGLSFGKILLIAAVIAAVWYGVKYLTRPAKQDASPGATPQPDRNPGGKSASAGGAPAVEDMVRCAVCGAYQARGAAACERADCPARR